MNPNKEKDADLIWRLSLGYESAAAALYDQYGQLVYQMALLAKQQNKSNSIDPDQVVVDAFVRMYKQSGKYNADVPLEKWVQLQTRLCIADKLAPKSADTGFWARAAEFARKRQRTG